MYKRIKIKKLGRKKAHREALMMNQLRGLFEFGYVKTTSPKANVLKSRAEALIAKYSGDLTFRRKIGDILGTKELVEAYMKYVKKELKGVKIIKVGFRSGDMGEVSRVELINFKEKKTKKKVDSKEEKDKKEVSKEDKKEGRKVIIGKKVEKQNIKVPVAKNLKVSRQRAKSRSGL